MAQHTPSALSVGTMLFPDLTLLDLAGPYDVFSRMQRQLVVAKTDASRHILQDVKAVR